MRITQDHLQFWREKKVPKPSWLPPPKYGHLLQQTPLIHILINQQTPVSMDRDKTLDVSNMLVTLRLVRKRQKLAPYLADIMVTGQSERRRANARKWLKKIMVS